MQAIAFCFLKNAIPNSEFTSELGIPLAEKSSFSAEKNR
jgi:hypothetical protein